MSYSGVALKTGEDYTFWHAALSASWTRPTSETHWAELMYDQGTIPFVHLMVDDTIHNINAGVHDAALEDWLMALLRYQATGRRMVVVLFPEMNGNWTPYGQEEPPDHQAFINVYRSIVDRGRRMGLDSGHVLWCWAPNDVGFPGDELADWYPGDLWVDIVGSSAYNWGGVVPGEPWESPAFLFDRYVLDVRQFTEKPIVITQTGAGLNDPRTPQWLSDATFYCLNYTNIEGFIYFNLSEFEYGPGRDDWNDRVEQLESSRHMPEWFDKEDPVPLSTAQMRIEWADYRCNSKDWATIEVLNRAPVKTITMLTEAWSAFERAMYFHGYGDAQIVSSYACRSIDGGLPSLHGYRLANDVDPALNGRQGSGARMDWSRCKLTRVQSDAVERIRTISGAQVFRNGWVFKNPDPMHFQIACTRADIATGINWSTVDGNNTAPPPQSQENDLYCRYGDGMGGQAPDENVKHWQTKLVALGFDVGGVDGKYGDKTKTSVIAVVPGSDGLQIFGVESGVIDVTLGKLGPAIPGGVEHQHPDYALQVHAHTVTGQAK